MKIVTYNVNGLRPRIAQFGSLLKLLESLDADIICFQETKISRQDLREDIVRADGYESFFSCTRTNHKSRSSGYSGVATFCRVKSAFSSNEVALPLAAEEGFTGLLENCLGQSSQRSDCSSVAEGLEDFPMDELLNVDSEGRCIITDHGHFVLFNIYGPRADPDDSERVQFKVTFFKILQRRWECLMRRGRRIIVAGDMNIAPAAIDRCEAGPDFEKNEFRRWFRSLLMENKGYLFDVFRSKHPERREAYTCWPANNGAEEFNYGSRIDHILCSRSCLHQEQGQETHNFFSCHVQECDILVQFQRWKPGNTPRWKAEKSIKLEGSDHVPVYVNLVEIPEVEQHSTPSLSSRYYPQICGYQQTLASMLMRRQSVEQVNTCEVISSPSDENMNSSDSTCQSFISCSEKSFEGNVSNPNKVSQETVLCLGNDAKLSPGVEIKKKARKSQGSQLTLKSFFQKTSNEHKISDGVSASTKLNQPDVSTSNSDSNVTSVGDDERGTSEELELNIAASQAGVELQTDGFSQTEKRNLALQEWQRIQQLMKDSVPLCKGHKERCVVRVVKKAGPSFGRRFYVCARGEGPASNPETNCGYFKWAGSNPNRKK